MIRCGKSVSRPDWWRIDVDTTHTQTQSLNGQLHPGASLKKTYAKTRHENKTHSSRTSKTICTKTYKNGIQNGGFVNFQQHHSAFSSFSANFHPGLVQNSQGFLCSASASKSIFGHRKIGDAIYLDLLLGFSHFQPWVETTSGQFQPWFCLNSETLRAQTSEEFVSLTCDFCDCEGGMTLYPSLNSLSLLVCRANFTPILILLSCCLGANYDKPFLNLGQDSIGKIMAEIVAKIVLTDTGYQGFRCGQVWSFVIRGACISGVQGWRVIRH